MATVFIRVYAELNELIPAHWRGRRIPQEIFSPVAVRDLIERLNIPHTEVDLVVVDKEPVGLDHVVFGGEHVAVYPVFESLDISALVRLRPTPLRQVAFVADVHLGRLARLLRLLGFDCAYRTDASDEELAVEARSRILLTKDRGLLKRKAVTHGFLVRARTAREQAMEVIERFDLASCVAPFTRCLACNALLEDLDPSLLPPWVPPRVRERHQTFARCPSCGRVFWPGTHYAAMEATLRGILASSREASPT